MNDALKITSSNHLTAGDKKLVRAFVAAGYAPGKTGSTRSGRKALTWIDPNTIRLTSKEADWFGSNLVSQTVTIER